MDYFLKAESETELWTVLESAGAARKVEIKDDEGNVLESRYVSTNGYNIDVIGTIYRPTGNLIQQTINDQTIEIPEMEAIPGFHANLRGPANLAPRRDIIPYIPTDEERSDPNFVMPDPEINIVPSPLQAILIDRPRNPSRVWA